MNFYNKYEKSYGKALQAGHGPAPAYESVYILAEAIERAGSLDPDAIVAELEKTDRTGVMGRVKLMRDIRPSYGFDPQETAVVRFSSGPMTAIVKSFFPDSIADGENPPAAGSEVA